MDTDQLREESLPADIPGLVAQARAAYQQNRIKECLALTRAALLVDPGNTAAIELQSAVRFDMQRDLSDARALIEESRNKPEAPKYRKAAEIILRKALYLDPESEGARTLLSSLRSATDIPAAPASTERAYTPPVFTPANPAPQAAPPSQTPSASSSQAFSSSSYTSVMVEEPPVEYAPMPAAPEPAAYESASSPYAESNGSSFGSSHAASSYVTRPEIRETEPIPFTTGTTFVDKGDERKDKKTGLMIPIVIVSIAVLAGGWLLSRQRVGLVQAAPASAVATTANLDSDTVVPAVGSAHQASNPMPTASLPVAPIANTVKANPPAAATLPPVAVLNVPANPAAAAATRVPAPAANTTPTPSGSGASATATGSLAVSSAIAAEIYMGDKYLGSTPTTLQLPAGSQTLEFRHGDLRATVTHVVKANETTTALVTFDVMVQVNAKPWANVFVEGTPRLPLGQTPLSDVRLPIGSVLIFENPNFPSKSHKIAVDDKTIQVAFQ